MNTTTTIRSDWSRTAITQCKHGFAVMGACYLNHTQTRQIAKILYQRNPLFKCGFKTEEEAINILAAVIEDHYCGLGCRDMLLAVDDETDEILGVLITLNVGSRIAPAITHLREQSPQMETLMDKWVLDNAYAVKREDPTEFRIINFAATSDCRSCSVLEALLEVATEVAFAQEYDRVKICTPSYPNATLLLRQALESNKFGRPKVHTEQFSRSKCVSQNKYFDVLCASRKRRPTYGAASYPQTGKK